MPWQRRLCGLAEAARVLGVSDTRVGQLSKEYPNFPVELDGLSCGRIWSYDDIVEFKRFRDLLLAARGAAQEEGDDGTQQVHRLVEVPEVVQGPQVEQP